MMNASVFTFLTQLQIARLMNVFWYKNGYINFLISFNMYCRCSDQLELNMYKNVLYRWIYDIYKNVICFCI